MKEENEVAVPELQSDLRCAHPVQLSWQQLLLWLVVGRTSCLRKLQVINYVLGEDRLLAWHM